MILFAATSLSELVAVSATVATVAAAIVGILFRGAATAWRAERDAAVDKAERLQQQVNDQATRITQLEATVATLQKQTNVAQLADRITLEHKEIVAALVEVRTGLHANTTAVEFLFKQLFPATVPAPPDSP